MKKLREKKKKLKAQVDNLRKHGDDSTGKLKKRIDDLKRQRDELKKSVERCWKTQGMRPGPEDMNFIGSCANCENECDEVLDGEDEEKDSWAGEDYGDEAGYEYEGENQDYDDYGGEGYDDYYWG